MRTFLRHFILPMLALASWSAAPQTAFSAVMRKATVADLTLQSDLVVRGKVASRDVQASADGGRIFTVITLEVSETWKGGAPARVQVEVPGGELGDIGQVVHGAPRFADGEDVVVFLRKIGPQTEALPLTKVVSLAQGKFEVIRDEKGTLLAVPDLSEVEFVGRDAAPAEAKAPAVPVQELEARVKAVTP